ncbi:hypothetical protein BASA81_008030 [Batrachochytrium salamandrivorans]|nr:hypothetical protein BASA81_008030 [Batrachochytrium salamandrivorans]
MTKANFIAKLFGKLYFGERGDAVHIGEEGRQPKFLKENLGFTSYQNLTRNLNYYGFSNVQNSAKAEVKIYAHPRFKRSDPHTSRNLKRNPTQRNRLKARMDQRHQQQQQPGRPTLPRAPRRQVLIESDSETEEEEGEEEEDDEDNDGGEDEDEDDEQNIGHETEDEQELDLSAFRPPGFPQTFSPSMEKSFPALLSKMEEDLLGLAPAIDPQRLPGDKRLDDPHRFVKFWLD